jgi:hypothetical protein
MFLILQLHLLDFSLIDQVILPLWLKLVNLLLHFVFGWRIIAWGRYTLRPIWNVLGFVGIVDQLIHYLIC